MLALSPRGLDTPGWQARLSLGFEPVAGRTAVTRRSHQGPLYCQRPFYPERDGTCHLYVLHPPGGVVGGDELTVEVDVSAGSRVLVTTPAATKLYRCPGASSVVSNRLTVGPDAVLEWLPAETIAFGGTHARLTTSVALDPGARFIGWEVTCLGRPAAGDAFASGVLEQRTELFIGGRPVILDRTVTEGGGSLQRGPWGWGGRSVHGLFLATLATGALVRELREGVRVERAGSLFGVTTLGGVTVCRFLGERVQDARDCLTQAWQIARRHLLDKPACAPRIWTT
jgi:urease accessory protein